MDNDYDPNWGYTYWLKCERAWQEGLRLGLWNNRGLWIANNPGELERWADDGGYEGNASEQGLDR